jgi:hypothetical protein
MIASQILLLESGSDGAEAPGEGLDQLMLPHLMRLRGRGKFHFERLRHFILTHFDLSYEVSQSVAGNSQPASHSYPRCPTLFVARAHDARSPTSRPQQSLLWGCHFFLFDTLHDHADRRLFS